MMGLLCQTGLSLGTSEDDPPSESSSRIARAVLSGLQDDFDNKIVGGGKPGRDFPILNKVPRTKFNCGTLLPGYYADVSTGCQVFHVCHADKRSDAFLCPNGTIFHQQRLVCDWWYNVNCDLSVEHFKINAGIGKVPPRKTLREKVPSRKNELQDHAKVLSNSLSSGIPLSHSKPEFKEERVNAVQSFNDNAFDLNFSRGQITDTKHLETETHVQSFSQAKTTNDETRQHNIIPSSPKIVLPGSIGFSHQHFTIGSNKPSQAVGVPIPNNDFNFQKTSQSSLPQIQDAIIHTPTPPVINHPQAPLAKFHVETPPAKIHTQTLPAIVHSQAPPGDFHDQTGPVIIHTTTRPTSFKTTKKPSRIKVLSKPITNVNSEFIQPKFSPQNVNKKLEVVRKKQPFSSAKKAVSLPGGSVAIGKPVLVAKRPFFSQPLAVDLSPPPLHAPVNHIITTQSPQSDFIAPIHNVFSTTSKVLPTFSSTTPFPHSTPVKQVLIATSKPRFPPINIPQRSKPISHSFHKILPQKKVHSKLPLPTPHFSAAPHTFPPSQSKLRAPPAQQIPLSFGVPLPPQSVSTTQLHQPIKTFPPITTRRPTLPTPFFVSSTTTSKPALPTPQVSRFGARTRQLARPTLHGFSKPQNSFHQSLNNDLSFNKLSSNFPNPNDQLKFVNNFNAEKTHSLPTHQSNASTFTSIPQSQFLTETSVPSFKVPENKILITNFLPPKPLASPVNFEPVKKPTVLESGFPVPFSHFTNPDSVSISAVPSRETTGSHFSNTNQDTQNKFFVKLDDDHIFDDDKLDLDDDDIFDDKLDLDDKFDNLFDDNKFDDLFEDHDDDDDDFYDNDRDEILFKTTKLKNEINKFSNNPNVQSNANLNNFGTRFEHDDDDLFDLDDRFDDPFNDDDFDDPFDDDDDITIRVNLPARPSRKAIPPPSEIQLPPPPL